MKNTIQNKMITEFKNLDNEQKLILLDFAKSLSKKRGRKKKLNILDFAGSISKKDLALMKKVIEEDCERIDENEWK